MVNKKLVNGNFRHHLGIFWANQESGLTIPTT